MKLFKLQPSFTIEVAIDQPQAIERLRRAIHSNELRGLADSAGSVFDFRIDPAERRFWSPHLSAQLSPSATGTQLFARFSPRPEVWTMFMAIYFVVAIGMGLGAIVAYAQWALGFMPSALLAIPIGTVMVLALHFGSLVGQNLGADQMDLLRNRLERAIELAYGDVEGSSA